MQLIQKTMENEKSAVSSNTQPTTQNRMNETVQSEKHNEISSVIRNCTILTMFSALSTWTMLICVIFGIAQTMDIHANILCVMLSNNFADIYYIKIWGVSRKVVWFVYDTHTQLCDITHKPVPSNLAKM